MTKSRTEYHRRWAQANKEHLREYRRRYYEANRERKLELSRNSTQSRERRALTAKFWQDQDGRCYLCEEPVTLKASILEHDHRCCPIFRFCRRCVRGVACHSCNVAIGLAQDDPARLELMAANLRARQATVSDHLAARPVQGCLELDL